MDITRILSNYRAHVLESIRFSADTIITCTERHQWTPRIVREQEIKSMEEIREQINGALYFLNSMMGSIDRQEYDALHKELSLLQEEVHLTLMQIIRNEITMTQFATKEAA